MPRQIIIDTPQNRDTRPNFVKLNDLLRHACHLTEVEGVTVETLEHITKRQKEIFGLFPENVLDQTYKTQAGEYLAFQQQMVKSVRWRAVATQERLEGEITLVMRLAQTYCTLRHSWIQLTGRRRLTTC